MLKNPPANAGNTGDIGSIPESGRALAKEMATHSSILAWRIPWTEEPKGPQSMGSKSWPWLNTYAGTDWRLKRNLTSLFPITLSSNNYQVVFFFHSQNPLHQKDNSKCFLVNLQAHGLYPLQCKLMFKHLQWVPNASSFRHAEVLQCPSKLTLGNTSPTSRYSRGPQAQAQQPPVKNWAAQWDVRGEQQVNEGSFIRIHSRSPSLQLRPPVRLAGGTRFSVEHKPFWELGMWAT